MILLNTLLKGRDITIEDLPEQAKAPKVGPLCMDDTVEGFEAPGIIPNPDFVASPDSGLPFPRVCLKCGGAFTCTPQVLRGEIVYSPLVCDGCQQTTSTSVNTPAGMVRVPRYIPGLAKTDENFCGYLLKPRQVTPIGSPVNPMKKNPTPATPSPESQTSIVLEVQAEVVPLPNVDAWVSKREGAAAKPAGPIGHATHGPSSLKHKEVCPHWRGDKGTNPAAEEGTMLHELLVTADQAKIAALDPEPRQALELVATIFDQMVRSMGPGASVYEERRMDVAGLTWGTGDLLVINGKRAKIGDAKFGRVQVEDAEENLQGICYAAATFFEFPEVDEVEVIFAQPRCDMVSSHTFLRSRDFEMMKLRIATVIARAEDPDAPYNPVPSNCTYCGSKATCGALHQLALKTATGADDQFIIPEELRGEMITNPVMMARAMIIAEVLEKWVDAVKTRGREMLLDGTDVPGYELGERKAPRTITDPALAWAALEPAGLPFDKFVSAVKSVSLPELEKIFAANAPRGKKGQAKQELEDLLTGADAIRQDGVNYYLKKKKPEPKQLPSNNAEEPAKTNAEETQLTTT